MSELAFNRAILERTVRILSFIVVCLILLLILQAVSLVLSENRPQQVVYAQEDSIIKLVTKNYEVDQTILKNFTKWIAKEYLSFSPTSLPDQIDGIKEYLTAVPQKSILTAYQKNKSIIEDGTYFNFVVNSAEIKKEDNPFDVELSGVMTIIDRKGNYKDENKVFSFGILQVKPTESNPYGLKVLSITDKSVTVEKGVSK
ncbi:MAG: hypothetical protein A2Y03_00620 [Omnitrophica WOR_2 bacterium GWF2_38_59]|nr:MAG: hypothetical protein A2Y03_00620 [Omnitrophica WOR_2 bacterium GWF2_38_59]OGX49519.1 MAG: hypothetical protein A2243_10585 [Omnitrophica WOR_2 bacterium RIFOXYA2_FULL_38_17]OGX58715.1 MAG: hypothetical protein A2306_12210 [Omnitrophica WOR_2 bacterium RIFOXYB2_FULL_38_16]HBG62176.1 hypothetical protein [Candidatus Omnitrophota bacterium]